MATIYRKVYPLPMPPGAEIITRRGRRIARWFDSHGREKTASLTDDQRRILYESDVWYARYRDADGIDRRVSTGCQDEQAARRVLSDILAKVEKVRAGILTPTELKVAGHADRPMAEHMREYIEHLQTKRVRGRRVSEHYRRNVKARLGRIIGESGFRRLLDINRQGVDRWLAKVEESGMAAGTRNEYLTSLVAFCNWPSHTAGQGPMTAATTARPVGRGASVMLAKDDTHNRRPQRLRLYDCLLFYQADAYTCCQPSRSGHMSTGID